MVEVCQLATLAKRLRLLRRERDQTQEELAGSLGVDRATLASWETGRREPDLETVARIADYFGVNGDYLLGRTDDPAPPGREPAGVTEEQVRMFFRGRGLTEGDLEIIRAIEEQRAKERREKGPRPKPDHPF